jgi:hypothetical protein
MKSFAVLITIAGFVLVAYSVLDLWAGRWEYVGVPTEAVIGLALIVVAVFIWLRDLLRMRYFAVPAIAVGTGLLIFGVLGFWGYGWRTDARLEAAIGAALILAGVFIRKDSK